MHPPLDMNFDGEYLLTSMMGALPSSPPNSAYSPAFLPYTGITLTAVVLTFTTPIAASSAIIAEIISSGTSPGIAIISRPTRSEERRVGKECRL